MKFLESLVELIYWCGIFLCPTVIFGVIGFVVYHNCNAPIGLMLFMGFSAFGAGLGIIFAEKIRISVGCSNFMTRATPWSNSKKEEGDK